MKRLLLVMEMVGCRQQEDAGNAVDPSGVADEHVATDSVGGKVTNDDLVHLKGLTSLQTLILGETKVTDAGLVHLVGLTNLKTLILRETQFTDAGIAELQKALPNCRIRN